MNMKTIMLRKFTRTNLTSLLLTIFLIFFQIVPATLSISIESINDEKIVVITVIEYLASVVREVGGEKVKVETIIPPNVDPHHYEPPLDIVVNALSKARLVVTTAQHHFPVEEKIHQIVSEGLIKIRIISLPDYQNNGLKLLINPKTNDFNIHGFHFSIKGLKAIASAIAEGLADIDQVNRQYYSERLNNYLDNLDKIEKTINSLLTDKEDIKVILYSPLLQYVAEDLGLKILKIIVSELDVEPTESDVSEMLRSLSRREADYILISDMEALENPKLIELLDGRKLPYVIIPLSRFTESPQLVSLSTAALIYSYFSPYSEIPVDLSYYNFLLMLSIIANIIFLAIIVLLVIKMRGYHSERTTSR